MNKKENIIVNGIAHIALSVKNVKKSIFFYKELMPFLGLDLVHQSNKSAYFIGGRTGILIQQISSQDKSYNFSQNNIGLHHFCFRARSEKDIYLVEKKLKTINAKIIRGPCSGPWAPGYFYILFEDPDKIRLEVNFVPNKGVFEKEVKFNPDSHY